MIFDLNFRSGESNDDDNAMLISFSLLLSCCVRCENSSVTIQSSVSKSALKEKEQDKSVQGQKKPGAQQNKNKDIDKFHLYFDFTSNIQRIQPHQVAWQTFLFFFYPS